MLKGNEGPEMVCWRCSRHLWPRVGGYWFLLLSPRGRCRFPGAAAAEAVLCLHCGRELREMIEAGAFAPGASYERVHESGRVGYSTGRPAGDTGEVAGAEGYGGLDDAIGDGAAIPAPAVSD